MHGELNKILNKKLQRKREEQDNQDEKCFGYDFVESLKSCSKKRDIDKGIRIHSYVLKKGLLEKIPHLVCALINMYAKCGMLAKAHDVLEESCFQNVFCWNALIGGYAHHGQAHDAVSCYEQMQSEGLFPDEVTLTCILKACGRLGAIDKGKQLHGKIMNRNLLKKDVVLGNALVDMYIKCGAFSEANELLEELPIRDVASWNSVIGGYGQDIQGHKALDCFERMQNDGLSPDAITFICVLKTMRSIEKGRRMHEEIVRRGLLEMDNIMLGNVLVDMYAKCGALIDAQKVLKELPVRDIVSWNALIAGYAQQGKCHETLACFEQMKSEGLSPDSITLVCILKACGSIGAIDEGKRIHKEIVSSGFIEKDIVIGTSLVDMYAKCGMLTKAQEVLEELCVQDVASWSAVIAGYAQHEQGHGALGCFERMQSEGLSPNEAIFTHILKVCGSRGDIEKGQYIHEEIVRRGLLEKNIVLGTALLDMYVKCGTLRKAHEVLEQLPSRDVVSWNAIISGYTQHDRCLEALKCFDMMQTEGISPSSVTFICMLKVCGNTRAMETGKQIHEWIIRSGLLKKDIVLGNALVDMYAKLGVLTEAENVLQELPIRDVVSWNALIAAYTQHSQEYQALSCFEHMQSEGISPDEVSFICILKACGSITAIDKGKQIHDEIINKGFLEKDVVLGNAVMDMYVKCGMPSKALKVFEALPFRDVVSFNTLISGFSQQGQSHEALDLYDQMQNEGLYPDIVTFICMLKVCGSTRAIAKGKLIHEEIKNNRDLLEKDIALGNALVDMYVKCSMLTKAKVVLEELPDRDTVSWSIVIAAYAQNGQGVEALNLFEQMESEGLPPDMVTFVHILEACGSTGAIDKGKQIHTKIVSRGLLEQDIVLGTALVNMYAMCGMLSKAKEVLKELLVRDIVSWNALIAAYAQQGQCEKVLTCYEELQRDGLSPDVVTFICILKACGSARAIDKGKQIHEEMMDRGLIGTVDVLGNALVDMYAKCGVLGKAQQMLGELPIQDAVPWNALVTEYTKQGQFYEALNCFEQMCSESLCPDVVTYICILKACGNLGAIEKGKLVHDEIRNRGLLADIVIGNALVDMYAKCGVITKAQQLLEEFNVRDVVSWNALISGYSDQGQGQEALKCLEEMQIEGLYPDELTFLSILSACSHSGLVKEAWILFCNMSKENGIIPKLEHHACMVVLFGYEGYFQKSMSLIKEMPSFDHPTIWLGMLGACRKWGNLKLGRLAFDEILRLDNTCAEAYVVMADIYATAGMQEDAEKLLNYECI